MGEREKIEILGWKILSLSDLSDAGIVELWGGDKE